MPLLYSVLKKVGKYQEKDDYFIMTDTFRFLYSYNADIKLYSKKYFQECIRKACKDD